LGFLKTKNLSLNVGLNIFVLVLFAYIIPEKAARCNCLGFGGAIDRVSSRAMLPPDRCLRRFLRGCSRLEGLG
jgi:hypothetical protein